MGKTSCRNAPGRVCNDAVWSVISICMPCNRRRVQVVLIYITMFVPRGRVQSQVVRVTSPKFHRTHFVRAALEAIYDQRTANEIVLAHKVPRGKCLTAKRKHSNNYPESPPRAEIMRKWRTKKVLNSHHSCSLRDFSAQGHIYPCNHQLCLHDLLVNAVWRVSFNLVTLQSVKHRSNMRRCGQMEFLARTV